MRIGIAERSPLRLQALCRALAALRRHDVIWTASDGVAAVESCARNVPDLLLMDLTIPGIDGVEATRRIMSESPCAIVILTPDIAANSALVYAALGLGALDVVAAPELRGSEDAPSAAPVIAKIDTISRLLGSAAPPRRGLIAIGASAGGPAALATLLSRLPEDFAPAVVVVQHLGEPFLDGLATWLGTQSCFPVRVAEAGDVPASGTVLLADTNAHLIVTATGRLSYTEHPADASYRPSIDVFFNSVARFGPPNAIGVLLTGMGRDGAAGLKSLREARRHTIAQDEQSSAVFGMPKAAASLGAAVEILPLDWIALRLTQLARQNASGSAS